jgi:hypothetical protein
MNLTEEQIQQEMNRFLKLNTVKKWSADKLRQRAIKSLERKFIFSEAKFNFSEPAEIKKSRELLRKYLDEYVIETVSDRNVLADLIKLEIIQDRLYAKMNNEYAESDKAVPLKILEHIHTNNDAILKLKEVLGLFKKEERKGFDAFKVLQKRYQHYLEENQASRTLITPSVCPNCGHSWANTVLLKIRTDKYDAQPHPMFKDRILGNKKIIQLYKENRLTIQEVAEILETSNDYIEWLVKKWNAPSDLKQENNEIKQESVS